MSHTETHPELFVPAEVKAHFPGDVSFVNDECPSFINENRRQIIYWFQESECGEPAFSIWKLDNDFCVTDEELAEGYSVNELNHFINAKGE